MGGFLIKLLPYPSRPTLSSPLFFKLFGFIISRSSKPRPALLQDLLNPSLFTTSTQIHTDFLTSLLTISRLIIQSTLQLKPTQPLTPPFAAVLLLLSSFFFFFSFWFSSAFFVEKDHKFLFSHPPLHLPPTLHITELGQVQSSSGTYLSLSSLISPISQFKL